jgi:hypothetical protein
MVPPGSGHVVSIVWFLATVLSLSMFVAIPAIKRRRELRKIQSESNLARSKMTASERWERARSQKLNRIAQPPSAQRANLRVWMQVAISLVFLGASIFIILSHSFDASDKHWAYGSAGTILGFWLRN